MRCDAMQCCMVGRGQCLDVEIDEVMLMKKVQQATSRGGFIGR